MDLNYLLVLLKLIASKTILEHGNWWDQVWFSVVTVTTTTAAPAASIHDEDIFKENPS